MKRLLSQRRIFSEARQFSTSRSLQEIRSILDLPDRIYPAYRKSTKGLLDSKLLLGVWPDPGPKNVLLVMKSNAANVRAAATEFAQYINENHPDINLIFEREPAESLEKEIAQPIYTLPSLPDFSPFPFTKETDGRTPVSSRTPSKAHGDIVAKQTGHPDIFAEDIGDPFHRKTDLILTLGGDGTILHAASLFSTAKAVPPMLSFSMGSLGFLGECHWKDHVKAFLTAIGKDNPNRKGYSGEFGVLRRGRLKVGVFDKTGQRVAGEDWPGNNLGDVHVMNEVNIHRGAKPHLAIVEVFVAGRKLTETVADGMIISTPTGSTAYSLSSGGAIVHPAVNSLLLTPICPRSLSFRPLVLPTDCIVTLRLSNRNRSSEVEVSVDGKKWGELKVNEEIRVWGEQLRNGRDGGWEGWEGGIPCVKINSEGESDGWVGGLNGLLKFNYPFGEEEL